MSLAIFDLDNTLINGDSDFLWGEFLVQQGLVDEQHYLNENQRFYDEYKAGTLDIYAFLKFSLTPLSRIPLGKLQELHAEFMIKKIVPIMLKSAFDLVNSHKEKGDYTLIITATNRFVTQPIATKFAVDDLIATEPEFENGRYTGNVSDVPCFAQGKVERLKKWLKSSHLTLDDSWFYSDSHNDLPLLKLVTHPIAVDADNILQQHAIQHNWRILSLRQ